MRYDYYEAIKADVRYFIFEEFTLDQVLEALKNDYESFRERVNDLCWVADDVTGNASGSYTFSTYDAEKNLLHNGYLLEEALADFGASEKDYKRCLLEPETADVFIRCHLLASAVDVVLDNICADYSIIH